MSSNRKLIIVAGIAIILAGLACTSVPLAFAQSSGATIVGQVTVNGNATNGVLVTCGSGSNTTFDYNGSPGYYVISGLPYNTSMPFKAEYQGKSYTDTVDPLPSGQQYSNIPTVNINVPVSTPTATPNVTATPAPNATATPEPNATATPAPNSTNTPTPTANATITATPEPVTPAPGIPASTEPPVAPEPVPETPTAVPATPVPAQVTPTAEPTIVITEQPTVIPSPTTPSPTEAKSPGFEVILAIGCLLGAAYIVIRKGR